MVSNTFKNLLAIGLSSGYQFKELKDALENKSKAPQTTQVAKTEQKKEVKEEEPEEEEEVAEIGRAHV